jgi:hypothetical protein
MKHIKLFESFNKAPKLTKEQIDFLNKHTEGIWEIDPSTGLVNIEGTFDCVSQGLIDLKGLRFGWVTGSFSCGFNKLESLDGSPEAVAGDFYCNMNSLKNLKGSPQVVNGSFYCGGNPLTSLEGAPEEVGGWFLCDKQLEGAPKEKKIRAHSQLKPLGAKSQNNDGWPLLGVHRYYNYTGPIKGSDIIKKGFKVVVEGNAFLRAWFDDYGKSLDPGLSDYDIFDEELFWGHTDENLFGIMKALERDGIDDITHMDLYSIVFAEISNTILSIDPSFKKDAAENEISAIMNGIEDITFLIDSPNVITGIKGARKKAIENLIAEGHRDWKGLDIYDLDELESHPDFPPFDIWTPDIEGIDIARKRSGITPWNS